MKILKTTACIAALTLSAGVAMAQTSMQGMGGMEMGKPAQGSAQEMHKASGTVKTVDKKKGVVALAHGPVATLNWPAMTMSFKVKDKKMLRKLSAGSKVDVEFMKKGDDYVITSVK